ncbi:hypothetical protein [Brasilonema sennae]|nr:hypothetical protein [Brasilonema sennae]
MNSNYYCLLFAGKMKLVRQAVLNVFGIFSLSFVAPVALSQEPQVGLEFKGFGLNVAQITITEFFGECPGEDIGEVKAHFISSVNPPSAGHRVVIRNVTEGMKSTPIPYTNREYDDGRRSQGITLIPGTEHKRRTFRFIPNKTNTFEFEILQDKQVINKGSFESVISTTNKKVERKMTWRSEEFCVDTDKTYMKDCKTPGIREKGSCPDSSTYKYRNIRHLESKKKLTKMEILKFRQGIFRQ